MQKSQPGDKKIFLTKKFTFDAAHKLLNHKGKCKNLHGHTYGLEVTVEGEVDESTGMIMDFDDMKEIVESSVLEKLDHQYINDIVQISTAENIIQWMWERLFERFKEHNVRLFMLKLGETPSSFVTYKLEKYEN